MVKKKQKHMVVFLRAFSLFHAKSVFGKYTLRYCWENFLTEFINVKFNFNIK